MGLRINTNVASLNAQRNLQETSRSLNTALERLSSGSRINRAGDDAAGLAISEGLQAQVRGLRQAVRNANDSLGFLNTAEGALSEITNITQRLRELAIQAANGAMGDDERGFLNEEASALLAEFDRIASQTEFNGTNLLDGSFEETDLQVGVNKGDTISFTIGDARTSEVGAVAQEVIESGSIDTSNSSTDFDLNGVTVSVDKSADESSPDGFENSAIALAAAVNEGSGEHDVSATVGATEGKLQTIDFTSLSDNNIGSGQLTINGVSSAFDDIGASSQLVDAINDNVDGVSAELNDNDEVVLKAEDGRNLDVTVGSDLGANMSATNGDGYIFTTAPTSSESATRAGEVTLESAEKIVVSGDNPGNNGLSAGTIDIDADTAISNLDISNQQDAQEALGMVDNALQQLNSLRADLGAVQNRLESTERNLNIGLENLSAAQSQIRDADIAEETAELTRSQILQQAGIAVLGQANTSSQVALSLLQF